MRVAWFTLESLTAALDRAAVDGTTARAIAKITRCDLIAVDDVGMLPAGQAAAGARYRLTDAAYERRSLIITPSLHPSRLDTIMPKTLAGQALACPLLLPSGAVEAEAFLAHGNLLFTVAYEMLGSAADAEDVLQETWLRWVGVDLATVRDQRAYLVQIVTRQALARLRTLGRRKESYLGSWLPEPLTTPDMAEDVELANSVSMAMLLVLETLTPAERAVFVLREVFDLGYDEIAEAVGKSPAAVRQIAHRARAHVAARRPRGVVTPAETRHALEAFQRAAETGDLQRLLGHPRAGCRLAG